MRVVGAVGRRARALMGTAVCGGLLAGCGLAGTSGFEAPRENTSTLGSITRKIGSLVSFNTLFPDSTPLPTSDSHVDCPVVEVQDGTASARFYRAGGQANGDVRYSFALGDVARECSLVGGQLQLKVGVEGRVLIGPAGAPGTFTVPLRIAVRNDDGQKVVSSQLTRITATIAPSDTQAGFTYVTEPFTVPTVPHPEEDYTILVGFDTSGKSAEPAPARKRTRKAAR